MVVARSNSVVATFVMSPSRAEASRAISSPPAALCGQPEGSLASRALLAGFYELQPAAGIISDDDDTCSDCAPEHRANSSRKRAARVAGNLHDMEKPRSLKYMRGQASASSSRANNSANRANLAPGESGELPHANILCHLDWPLLLFVWRRAGFRRRQPGDHYNPAASWRQLGRVSVGVRL